MAKLEVEKIPIRTEPASAEYLRRILSSGFEGRRERKRYADQVVSYATTETVTVQDTLQGVYLGYYFIANGEADIGRQILDQIEEYLNPTLPPGGEGKLRVVHKFLRGYHTTAQQASEYIDQSIKAITILGKRDRRETSFPGIEELIDQASKGAYQMRRMENPEAMPLTTLIPERVRVVQKSEEPLIIFNKRILSLSADLANSDELAILAGIPDEAMEAIRNIGLPADTILPNALHDRYSGLTFAEIISRTDVSNLEILKYIAALPKGDVIYEYIAQTVFFTNVMFPADRSVDEVLEDTEFTKRIVNFQQWLINKLFLPVFEPDKLDREFDQAFIGLMQGKFIGTQFQIANTLFGAALYNTQTLLRLYPELSIVDVIGRQELLAALMKQAEAQTAGIPSIYTHQLMLDFFDSHYRDIAASFNSRFKNTRFVQTLLFSVAAAQEDQFKQSSEESVVDEIITQLGPEFIRVLKDREVQFQETIADIWNGVKETGVEVAYYLYPGSSYEKIFDPDSALGILGFSGIEFIADTANNRHIHFILNSKNNNLALVGIFDAETGLVIQLGEEFFKHTEISTFIHLIATTYYNDFVSERREERQAVISGPRRSTKERQSGTTEATATDEGQLEITLEKDLPRTHRPRYRREPLPEGVVEHPAEQIQATGQTERRRILYQEREQKRVPLGRAGAYREALQAYLLDQSETNREALRIARERIYQISTDKRDNAPPRFNGNLEVVIDPVNGDEIFLETWRVKHTIPKLTEEEQADIRILYRNRFKGTGHTAKLLDELIGLVMDDTKRE